MAGINAIQYAINETLYEIPQELLEAAFFDNSYFAQRNTHSIGACIRRDVIDARVNLDVNLVGGTQINVPIWGLQAVPYLDHAITVKIPKSLTQGRSITVPLSIIYGLQSSGISGQTALYQDFNEPATASAKVQDSFRKVPEVSTSNVHLIEDNVIMISEMFVIPANTWLRCMIENEEELGNIQPPYYQDYAMLVMYATKAYLYRKLKIRVDKGELHAGRDLGTFRDILDSYSDANENYREFLDKDWRKTAVFNDYHSRRRHINMITIKRP